MSPDTCGNARGSGCWELVFVWQSRADLQANSMSAPLLETLERAANPLCSHL